MSRQLGIVLDHFDRGGDCAAIRVSEHHDEWHAQKLHRKFETGEPIVIGEIAREPDNKKIAGSLVERNFRGNARIRAAQDRGNRLLRTGPRRASGGKIPMCRLVGNIAGIALHEAAQRRIGTDRVGLRLFGSPLPCTCAVNTCRDSKSSGRFQGAAPRKTMAAMYRKAHG